jgi:AraC-like DNA-binding protein
MYLVEFPCDLGIHGDMHIGWAGYVVARPGESRPHSHNEGYELHFMDLADGVFINGGTPVKVHDGDLVLCPPGEIHEPWPETNRSQTRFHFLLFTPDSSEAPLMRDVCSGFLEGGRLKTNAVVGLVFDRIRNKTNSNHVHLHKSAVHDLLALLYELVEFNAMPQSDAASRSIDHLVGTMKKNVRGTICLDDIARRIKMDKSYMIRCFTKKMGMPPMRYFLKLKIDTAGQWLHWSDDPVRVIATKLSFYDEFHFSRMFKRTMGCSPSEYRKRRPSADMAHPRTTGDPAK